MKGNNYIIDIDAARRPYNSYLVLPLPILKQLTPLICEEIMQGLVSSDDQDRVVLQLSLDEGKIREVNRLISTLQKKPARRARPSAEQAIRTNLKY
jgi:hypothetical protein